MALPTSEFMSAPFGIGRPSLKGCGFNPSMQKAGVGFGGVGGIGGVEISVMSITCEWLVGSGPASPITAGNCMT